MGQIHYPSAGYRGILTIGTDSTGATGTLFPYSNSSVAERVDVITPEVNGFAGQVGLTIGSKLREGDVTMPILGTAMLSALLAYFVSESARTTLRYITIDNTFNKMIFQGFLRSLSVSCEPGAGVTATLGLVGGIIEDVVSPLPVSYSDTELSDHAAWTANAGFMTSYVVSGAAQIPFQKTRLFSTSGGLSLLAYQKEVSGWSFNLNNNTGTTGVTASNANDPQGMRLHQGQQTGDGRLTLINPFVDTSSYENAPDWTDLSIALTNADGTSPLTVKLLRVINHTYGVPNPSPNQRIIQPISFSMTTGTTSTVNNILFTVT